jgi:hypothetical protein
MKVFDEGASSFMTESRIGISYLELTSSSILCCIVETNLGRLDARYLPFGDLWKQRVATNKISM